MCTGTRRMMHQCFYIQGEIISTMGWIISRLKRSFTNFIDTSSQAWLCLRSYTLQHHADWYEIPTEAAGSSKAMQNSRLLLPFCTATWRRRSQPQFSPLWYTQIASNIVTGFCLLSFTGGGKEETGLRWPSCVCVCVCVCTCTLQFWITSLISMKSGINIKPYSKHPIVLF